MVGADAPDLQEVQLDDVIQESSRFLDSKDSIMISDVDRALIADRNQFQLLVRTLIGYEHGSPEVTITIGELPYG